MLLQTQAQEKIGDKEENASQRHLQQADRGGGKQQNENRYRGTQNNVKRQTTLRCRVGLRTLHRRGQHGQRIMTHPRVKRVENQITRLSTTRNKRT